MAFGEENGIVVGPLSWYVISRILCRRHIRSARRSDRVENVLVLRARMMSVFPSPSPTTNSSPHEVGRLSRHRGLLKRLIPPASP